MTDERVVEAVEDEDDDAAESAPREVVYRYDDGLVDYVKHLNANKDAAHRSIISFEAEQAEPANGNSLSLESRDAVETPRTPSRCTPSPTRSNTHEGGTHEEGFRAALTTLVNKYGELWGFIKKKEDRLSGDDVREGLTAIISIKLAEPQFEGQTKTKLGNTEAKSFVQTVVNDDSASGSRRTLLRARTSSARDKPR